MDNNCRLGVSLAALTRNRFSKLEQKSDFTLSIVTLVAYLWFIREDMFN